MSPTIVAAIITGSAVIISSGLALTGVIFTIRAQTKRIDEDNRAALAAQTGEIKKHLKEHLADHPQAPPVEIESEQPD